MAIEPINLPSAAGLEYGHSDVRHFSEGDSVSVPGISNPTRHLAERDNKIRDKLNEVIGIVNNTEQFVPLPLVRTTLAPNDEVVAANYRIPAGFEARVLNASVSAVPASTDIALIVYYNEGFGGSTGTEVVSTATEFTGGVQFYNQGEFVVVMRNTGSSALDFASSVLLTLRPLGAQGTLLVGSTVVGPPGPTGPAGSTGLQGPPGMGVAGPAGMIWKGIWTPGLHYDVNSVVSHITGTAPNQLTSSYVCIQAHTASAVGGADEPLPPPATNAYWQPVAVGSVGPAGTPGTPGGAGSSAEIPVYRERSVDASFLTGLDWVGLAIDGYPSGGTTVNTAYPVTLREVSVESSAATGGNPKGFVCLNGRYPVAMSGSGTLTLPNKLTNGAKVDYTNTYVTLTAVANGTSAFDVPVTGRGFVDLCTSQTVGANQFVVKVRNPDPVRVMFLLTGVQPIF